MIMKILWHHKNVKNIILIKENEVYILFRSPGFAGNQNSSFGKSKIYTFFIFPKTW